MHQNLQVWVNWFSELLQALMCFRFEVLQDVLKVVFFAKMQLQSEQIRNQWVPLSVMSSVVRETLRAYLHDCTPGQAWGCFSAECDLDSRYALWLPWPSWDTGWWALMIHRKEMRPSVLSSPLDLYLLSCLFLRGSIHPAQLLQRLHIGFLDLTDEVADLWTA